MKEMQLFYTEEPKSTENLAQDIRDAYGIKKGHLPHGATGYFGWGLPDVYLSEELSRFIERVPGFAENLRGMILSFHCDDYGFVTMKEKDNNSETRYLCGSNRWMIGRYPSLYGGIVLETLYDIAILYFVYEDISDICQSQFDKFSNETGADREKASEWRMNQLKIVDE